MIKSVISKDLVAADNLGVTIPIRKEVFQNGFSCAAVFDSPPPPAT